MTHKTGIILLIIGGICMLIGSVTGGIQIFETIYLIQGYLSFLFLIRLILLYYIIRMQSKNMF